MIKMNEQEFLKATQSEREQLEEHLKNIFEEQKKLFEQPVLQTMFEFIKDFTCMSGKRLRPVMFMKAYAGLGGTDDISKVALSVELFHNSTLIHDDIMDEDDTRRSKPSMHERWRREFKDLETDPHYRGSLFINRSTRLGATQAIIAGNIMLALAQKLLIQSKADNDKVLSAMNRFIQTYVDVNAGQALDTYLETKDSVSEEEYLNMAHNKTARLFEDSLRIAATLSGANEDDKKLVSDYARNFALGFQLHDDLMDISMDHKKGNTFASDILEGKQTLLVIKALEMASKAEKKVLKETLGNKLANPSQIRQCVDIIKKCGALDYVIQREQEFCTNAQEIAKNIAWDASTREFFVGLAKYVISRKR